MNKPPLSTLIFENIPDDAMNWLIGIDTAFFTISSLLKGIKNLPKGHHLFHYSIPSEPSSLNKAIETSLRYGQWLSCDDDVMVIDFRDGVEVHKLNTEEESLNYTKYVDKLGDIYPFMVTYPEDTSLWSQLTKYIDGELVQEFIPRAEQGQEISTVTPSKEENMVLRDKLPQSTIDETQDELTYTIIQFKLNREFVSVENTTKDYLEKSWYFEQLYGHDLDLFLGELQLSFIMFIVLGNFCSGLQWINLVKLLLMCQEYMKSHSRFALKFVQVFEEQLKKLPEEYVVDEITLNSAVDTKKLVEAMENFSMDIIGGCCGDMKVTGKIVNVWEKVKGIAKEKFGVEIEEGDGDEEDVVVV